jgi:hypothetical protein
MRRLAAPVRLAATRLRYRPERTALVAGGLATAAAMLAVVAAGSLVAQDRSIARRVAGLPDSTRSVRAIWFGLGGESEGGYRRLDRIAVSALRPVLDREPARVVLFRESTIAGAFVGLGGVDGLGRWVRLRSGRLPAPCRPERCEVVQLRGTGRLPSAPGLRVVRVGWGDLVSGELFGDAIPPLRSGRREAELSPHLQRAGRYHQPPPPPVVLAEGVEGLAGSPVLRTVFRSYAWVVPLDPEGVHPWSVDRTSAAAEQARAQLGAQASFDLTAPLEELAEARQQARVGGRRLLLLGGQAAALLLAFALLAAARLRSDAEAARLRLTWLGASQAQAILLEAAEVGGTAIVGVAAGWLGGAGIAALVAGAAGSPAAGIVHHSLLSLEGILLAALLAVVATAILVAALVVPPLRVGGRSLTPLDGAALAAVAIVVVAVARGAADEASLRRGGGTGFVLFLLPALIAFAAAVVTARLLGPALRGLERLIPERAVTLRLAALSLARNPGSAAVAVGFIVVSSGLALFAEAYRATLVRAQREQAAFAVPADVVLRENLSRLVTVSTAVTPAAQRRLAGRARISPVIRATSSVSGRTGATGITVLGLDAGELPRLDGWRDDFARLNPAELARRIAPSRPVELRGPALPPGATRLVLPVTAHGSSVSLLAYVLPRSGPVVELELGRAPEDRRVELGAALPREAAGGRLLALRLLPPERLVERGADAGRGVQGSLTVGAVAAVVDGHRIVVAEDLAGWHGVNGATLTARTARFALANQGQTFLRPRQPVDGVPLAVVASPRVAALADREGLLPLAVAGTPLVARVTAVAERFPGIRGDFVVADRHWLAAALDIASPGSARIAELWLEARMRDDALEALVHRPPFDLLEVVSRREYQAGLESDPIARASLLMLVAGAFVALVLGVAGLVLGVVAELRDERRELLDLEALGAAPASLRRQLRIRALVLGVFGVVGGVVAGSALAALVVRVVSLTAGATAPEPPLVLAVGWPVVLAALALAAPGAAALVFAATARAFRAPVPVAGPGGGT